MLRLNGQKVAEFVPEIADNLTTDDSTKALSGKQGKVLNDKVSGLKTIKEDTKTYTTDQYGHSQFGSDFNYGKNVIQIFCLNRQSNRQASLYTWNSGIVVSLSDGGGTQIPNETNDYRVVYFT